MGIFKPTQDPVYDHSIDIDAFVPCTPLRAAFAMIAPLDPKFHEIASQSLDQIVLIGRSSAGRRSIWVETCFVAVPGGTRVRTKIARARVGPPFWFLFIPVGRKRIKSMNHYRALLLRWTESLALLQSAIAGAA